MIDLVLAAAVYAGGGQCKPLVVELHGAWGAGGIGSPATREQVKRINAHYVAPSAKDGLWDLSGNRDVKMLRKLVKDTKASKCVTGTYVVGKSHGAHMASVMACKTNVFDGVVAMAGVTAGEGTCKRGGGESWSIWHSRDDNWVPFDGRIVLPAILPAYTGVNRIQAASTWAARNHCKEKETRGSLIVWKKCDDGVKVKMTVGENWGHGQPAGWDRAVYGQIQRWSK